MEGWIKIHRKMTEWEWYKDNNTKILFLHLLLTANHKEQKWKGITISRGQKLTSLQHLSEETNLTLRQVRTSLDKLKSTNEITIKTTHQYTLVTIEKYNNYQDKDNQNDIQNDIQVDNQATTNKNDKNNIYISLLNKYKPENPKDFSQYMSSVRRLKEDEQYELLTIEEQRKIIYEI